MNREEALKALHKGKTISTQPISSVYEYKYDSTGVLRIKTGNSSWASASDGLTDDDYKIVEVTEKVEVVYFKDSDDGEIRFAEKGSSYHRSKLGYGWVEVKV